MPNNKVLTVFVLVGARQTFKHKTDGVCLTELTASTLARTSKQTGKIYSADTRPTKRVRIFDIPMSSCENNYFEVEQYYIFQYIKLFVR